MAKADKTNKKAASKKPHALKQNSAVAFPPAKSLIPKAVKKSADSKDDVSDSSSSEDSSSEESDHSSRPKVSASAETTDSSSDTSSSEDEKSDDGNKYKMSASTKIIPAKSKSLDDSSDTSSSEGGNEDEEMVSGLAGTTAATKMSDSEEDSSDKSSSEESSRSESDSDEEEDDKITASAPTQTALAEANKKRKADSDASVPLKKAKVAIGNTNAVTPNEETRSIFVGRLSWNVDNDWLAREFAECGEVESAYVQTDRNTGRSRGFGYVHFKTANAVEKALELNGKEIDGRAVNVDRSVSDKKASAEKRALVFGDTPSAPSAVLFVGNLSFGVSEDTLWETFGEHGDVKSVRVPTDRETGKPKGFAYVEFSETTSAKNAHETLQGFELQGRSIRLDFSQPRDGAGARGGGQGGRGNRGGGRGRGGFGGDRGRGAGRGARGGDRGGRGRGRGRGARTGGITHFEGQKITFD